MWIGICHEAIVKLTSLDLPSVTVCACVCASAWDELKKKTVRIHADKNLPITLCLKEEVKNLFFGTRQVIFAIALWEFALLSFCFHSSAHAAHSLGTHSIYTERIAHTHTELSEAFLIPEITHVPVKIPNGRELFFSFVLSFFLGISFLWHVFHSSVWYASTLVCMYIFFFF